MNNERQPIWIVNVHRDDAIKHDRDLIAQQAERIEELERDLALQKLVTDAARKHQAELLERITYQPTGVAMNTESPEGSAVPQRAVPEAADTLRMALSTLEINVERLEDRLAPVLTIEQNDGVADTARPRHSVPLAEELIDVIARIEALNGRTLDVLDRLHV